MKKTVFMFAGQGSQYIGMGKDLYENFESARRVFRLADEALQTDLSGRIFFGDEEELKKTEVTQPAVLTTSISIFEVLKDEGIYPDAVAGLSLGEYSALVAAGAISLDEALPLVQKRGRYMQEAVPPGEGTMAAVLGLGREAVEDVCRQASRWGIVEPANYNCPGQVVIAGETGAVKRAMELAREKGAKRVMELNVSAPFHCRLLRPVEEKIARELDKIRMEAPRVPVVANVSADFLGDPAEIKDSLVRQVSNPVRWEDSINNLISRGYDTFLEIGPGKALSGFVKKISRELWTSTVEDLQSLEKVKKEMIGL